MAFTTFIDDLALIEVFLLLAAAVLAYGGVMAWWSIRTNQATGLRSVLKGMAVPLGVVGSATTLLALWGEMTWPFLASDGMAGYNIFFFDALLLFGLVLLAYAASCYLRAPLQYAGLFALVAGGAIVFYGWTGYTATPAFTKDPLETMLLYTGFGFTGVFAFPATLIVDHYLKTAEAGNVIWRSAQPTTSGFRGRRFGTRGVQPVATTRVAPTTTAEVAATPTETRFHVPIWAQSLLLLFPLFAGLAAIAALWYFGVTLPGHLGAGPGAAP